MEMPDAAVGDGNTPESAGNGLVPMCTSGRGHWAMHLSPTWCAA